MKPLPIYRYPSQELRAPTVPVPEQDFGTVGFLGIIDLMRRTCRQANGLAIAAPQCGIPERFFVLVPHRDYAEGTPTVVCNPEIADPSGVSVYRESCLSLPGVHGQVKRHARFTLKYQDEMGNHQIWDSVGLFATVAQHELDHLNSILFIDKLEPYERQKAQRAINKLRPRK
jgi:peptide deformylase